MIELPEIIITATECSLADTISWLGFVLILLLIWRK